MTDEQRSSTLKRIIRVSVIAYILPLLFFGLLGDISGANRADLTNTFATVTGVMLGIYAAAEKRRQLLVVILLLISLLVSMNSSVISLSDNLGNLAKPFFLSALVIFALSTYYFATSTSLIEEALEERKRRLLAQTLQAVDSQP